MKIVKILIVSITFTVMCINVNAQPGAGRINRAVQRGAERAAEKKAEEKAEEEVGKAIDKAESERVKGEAELQKLQKEQEEADAKAASMSSEIPAVGNNPYTPNENEFVFFPVKKGTVQLYVTKDTKGKIASQTRNTIKEITGDKNAFAIHYQSEMLDEKGKLVSNKDKPNTLNYKVVVKNGIMYLDMKDVFGAMDGIEEAKVSGSVMKIPTNLSVGQTLENASSNVRVGFVSCTAIVTDIKCTAIEDVTVEAGTFKCYKISQKVNLTIMGIKSEGVTVNSYAKGIGIVKTEHFDRNGKLISTQELKSNTK